VSRLTKGLRKKAFEEQKARLAQTGIDESKAEEQVDEPVNIHSETVHMDALNLLDGAKAKKYANDNRVSILSELELSGAHSLDALNDMSIDEIIIAAAAEEFDSDVDVSDSEVAIEDVKE
jgi:hypothetical protein